MCTTIDHIRKARPKAKEIKHFRKLDYKLAVGICT